MLQTILDLGETITLTDATGRPLAVVVSLNPPQAEQSRINWAEWEKLAEEIGRAWSSNETAVETVAEMRR